MKKIFKIGLLLLISLIVVIISLNWDKILILKEAFTNKYTEKDIEILQNESYEKLKEAAENTLEVEIKELSEEEKKALEKGEISEEDAKDIILGEKEFVDGNVVEKKPENPVEKPAVSKPAVDRSADIISQIYVLEALYKGKLQAIEDNMLSTYNKLPNNEKTTANKYKLANDALTKGTALKNECDVKMKSLLSDLEQNLKDCGKSTTIVKEIKSTYEAKKKATQAYYFQKYTNR